MGFVLLRQVAVNTVIPYDTPCISDGVEYHSELYNLTNFNTARRYSVVNQTCLLHKTFCLSCKDAKVNDDQRLETDVSGKWVFKLVLVLIKI